MDVLRKFVVGASMLTIPTLGQYLFNVKSLTGISATKADYQDYCERIAKQNEKERLSYIKN